MYQSQKQDRVKSLAAVAAFHALLGYAFITGLGMDMAKAVDDQLKIFDVPDAPIPPPLEEPEPLKEQTKEKAPRLKPAPKDPEGAAAPPNIKSRPTEIVAPKREVVLDVPTPVVAAPIAGPGAAATSGNAPFVGPGTGAGGTGNGTGSGRYGNGGGGGGGAGLAQRPRLIRDGVRSSDYPRSALRVGFQGTVIMRFLITARGHIGRCEVTRSSGHSGMDRETCAVMQKRLLFTPARDIYGRPVSAWFEGEQEWLLRQQPDRWIEADVPDDE